MTRAYIFCEGQTEEAFVRELLVPHFEALGIWISPIVVKTGRGRGGITSYDKIRRQIDLLCKKDPSAHVTTLMDYYAFPEEDKRLTPVRQETDPIQRALALTEAFQKDIGRTNFIANLVVHEYEGLLFSAPDAFESWFDEQTVHKVSKVRESFPSPEHINDNRQSAPSKRLLQICGGYAKAWHGPLIALDIGLDTIRRECPIFNAWLVKLEELTGRP